MTRERWRQPSNEDRRRTYEAVRSIAERISVLRPGATETAEFLLDQARESFQRASARIDRFEAKATTLLGIVAGASGALAAFRLSRAPSFTATPLLMIALGSITVATLCALYLLRPKRFADIDVSPLLSAKMAESDNRVALALIMARLFLEMTDVSRSESENEPRVLLAAYGATALAAMFLIANAIR